MLAGLANTHLEKRLRGSAHRSSQRRCRQMPPSRGTRFRPCAYLVLVLLAACLPRCAFASCPFGISPETARRVFNRVKSISIGDGYRFEGVGTNKSEMVVLWSLNGVACPPIQVKVENCTPLFGLPRLQLHVPPELPARCPGLQAVVQALSSTLPGEHAVRARSPLLAGEQPTGESPSIPPSALPLFSAVVALIVVVGLLIRRLLPSASERRRWEDIGWIAGVLAAAAPFLFNLALAVTVELGAAWLVFAVLLFDRERLAAESRALKLSLLVLFFVSLLLHWLLSSGGPGDLRLNLASIWSPELELRWGPAPVALFRLLGFVLGGIWDTHILWCNLILSGLVPILLYGIMADLGVGKIAAWLGALVAAAHPFTVAFSGVLERQPTYCFAAFGSLLALIAFLQRGGRGRFLAFVLGTALAITSRPEGAQVVILHLAILLLVPASRRSRGAVAIALAVLIPLTYGYLQTLGSKFPGSGNPLLSGRPFLWTILLDRNFTPFAWIIAWILGLAVGIRQRAAWVALLSLLGLDVLWKCTSVYNMFVGHERQVASARYESILLVPFAIAMALLVQTAWKMRPWLRVSLLAAFIACTAMTFRRPFETLLRPFTIDYEYRFLKKYALTLAPGSRLYIFDSPVDDVGLIDAHLVGQFAGSAVDFVAWSARQCDQLFGDASPTYLYLGSSCAELIGSPDRSLPAAYAQWLQDCAAIRARVAGTPVEEIDVPAHKMSWHDFKGSTVRLAVYRLTDASICALGPRYPWRPEPSPAPP